MKKTLLAVFLTAATISAATASAQNENQIQNQNQNRNQNTCQGVNFNRQLAIGSRGNEVRCLQSLLNRDPGTKVAETGPGSPGQETDYFGPLTQAALTKFQQRYIGNNITGFDNQTMQALNNMINGTNPTPINQQQGTQNQQNKAPTNPTSRLTP